MKYKMPAIEAIGAEFKKFSTEADETVKKLKKKELDTAIKKQAGVMEYLWHSITAK